MNPARLVNRFLHRAGFHLGSDRHTLVRSLETALAAGLSPATVIDVGAAHGDWSRQCRGVYPQAAYILVEPLEEYQPFHSVIPRTHVYWMAAGAASGTATIHVHRDLVGSSLYGEAEGPAVDGVPRRVEVTTVDALTIGAKPSFLLKADTQGSELDVLKGADRTLSQTELVILEVSLLRFFQDGPLLADIVTFMRDRGFAAWDVFGAQYRPLDGALSQVDIAFAPEDGVLRMDHRYATPEQRRAQDEAFTAANLGRRA